MTNRDIETPIHWADIPAAIGLLTRLPVRVDTDRARTRGALAAWAYPLVGVLVGGLAAIVGYGALALGLPAAAVALIILATQMVLTGGLHEDGLADSADGLWGGWDTENRLRIMNDSQIGSYGVLVLIVVTGLRWAAVTALLPHGFAAAVIACAIGSRAPVVAMMHMMPNARHSGLSQSVGTPHRITVQMAMTLALIGILVLTGLAVIPLVITATISALLWSWIAMTKIKGQTGDILGAAQQITETAMLLCAAALFAS